MSTPVDITIGTDDALIVVDVQNDFLPGGAVAVNDGDAVVPVINECIQLFTAKALPIFATADWHPGDHCSFVENGGQWPKHCVADSSGAQFAESLELPAMTTTNVYLWYVDATSNVTTGSVDGRVVVPQIDICSRHCG